MNEMIIGCYLLIGLLWTIAMSPLWVPNSGTSKNAKRITILVNVLIWWLCIIIHIINKARGKPTLF